MPAPHRLREHLEDAADLLVVLAPGTTAEAVRGLGLPEAAQLHELASPMPRPRGRDAVLLVVPDLASLRRALSGVGNFGAARRIGVCFLRDTERLPTVTPQPGWPPIDDMVASRTGDRFVLLTFSRPAQVRPVLREVARAAASSRSLAPGWPTLGAPRNVPTLWPVADGAATVAMAGRLFDGSVEFPPDLVFAAEDQDVPDAFTVVPHRVLGRAPVVVRTEHDLSWEDLAGISPEEGGAALERRGTLSLGAVDEHVLNPIGFDRDRVGPPNPLRAAAGTRLTVPAAAGQPEILLDPGLGVSEADLPRLRRHPGLELDWQGAHGPQSYCRVVAGLAAAGIPLVAREVPGWARRLLPPELADAIGDPTELTDRLAREERSIELRRAALRTLATGPWRRALAEAHGVQSTPPPRISVLLVTRRPEMIPFALRQVARQRGVDLEVVLATHGFTADPGVLESFRETSPAPLTTVSADPVAVFGEVLNQAVEQASGDVLAKMDDDDWYGPDFLSDLLLARGYSGAEIVGCPPELTFVEPLWVTTRRQGPTETYAPFVAGGTLLVDRTTLRALGGFRSTVRSVDATLLSAVTDAGGSVYRTQGLGYVLRRGSQGHTWDPGLGYFVTRNLASTQWRGFHPSRLLEAATIDLPTRPGMTECAHEPTAQAASQAERLERPRRT